MSNKENLQEILETLRVNNFDKEAIEAEYQKDGATQSLAIKILSIFGGILASFAFLVFLLITGLWESETGLLIFGTMFIFGAIFTSKQHDKEIIFDTLIVSFFIIGFWLLGIALNIMKVNETVMCFGFIIIAFLSIMIACNYILTFISTLIISGSILSIMVINNAYNCVHFYIAISVAILVYFFLKEARVISENITISKLYNPIRTGLTFLFLAGLVFVCKQGLFPVSPAFIWLSSVFTISAVIYLLSNLFEMLNINETSHKIAIYIFTLVALLPTAFSPAISGALLLILLSFYVNYKIGLVLGVVAFIYFISQYYYDLNFTLLAKSVLLFVSGVVFLALYLFTHQKLITK